MICMNGKPTPPLAKTKIMKSKKGLITDLRMLVQYRFLFFCEPYKKYA